MYPAIDPVPHFTGKTFVGKVVLVTGASRGIGLETAIFFARAGASLAILARKQATLDESKAEILKVASDAKVITFVADVRDYGRAKEVVEGTVREYGRLDVVVANAGVTSRIGTSKLNTRLDYIFP